VPTDVWLSKDYHRIQAEILRHSKPKIDLSEHVKLTAGPPALAAAGVGPEKPEPPAGSCELSIVDPEGNWVQMMNTLQSGGIPGEVVDGVCMTGSHAVANLQSSLMGWFTGGGRMREMIGNTLVLKDGQPWLSLGTPGNVHCTMPQVLSNLLDYGMDPYEAIDVPRLLPLTDDYKLAIESRIPESVVKGLAQMGVLVKPLPTYDYHMGSFQMAWRDEKTGLMSATSDPRRAGNADGF
jgi:gamma-glutamyltranspeptidase/glutathione hydrolase